MRDHTYRPFIILSAERLDLSTEVNKVNSERLEKLLLAFREETGSGFQNVTGVYKGVCEKSVIVYTSDELCMVEFASKFKQESILVRNGHNDCHLRYVKRVRPGRPGLTGRTEFLGHFLGVSKAEALAKHDSYTIMRVRGKEHYWVCEKGPYIKPGEE